LTLSLSVSTGIFDESLQSHDALPRGIAALSPRNSWVVAFVFFDEEQHGLERDMHRDAVSSAKLVNHQQLVVKGG
jgi:hypothetical protein